MSKAEEYLNKTKTEGRIPWDRWRCSVISLLTFAAGGLMIALGSFDMAFPGSDGLKGLLFVLIGLIAIVYACKPRKEGG